MLGVETGGTMGVSLGVSEGKGKKESAEGKNHNIT